MPNVAPDIDLSGAELFYLEEEQPAPIAPAATLVDPDSDFSAGSLTVTLGATGTFDDQLTIGDEGTGTGQIGLAGGHAVQYEGVTIGTWSGGAGGSDLVITFQSGASAEAVEALIRDIDYSSNSLSPSVPDRHVSFVVADGDGGSDSADATIHVGSGPIVLNQPYTSTFADAGTGAYSLNIGVPTDTNGDPLTVTIDHVPTYGTVEYFDGSGFVTLAGGETLTPDELATLQYTPAGDGEKGGGSVQYTVSDGVATVHSQIDIHDVGEEIGFTIDELPVAFFSAQGPAPATGPDLYYLDSLGDPPTAFPLGATDNGSSAGELGGYVHFNGALFFFADVDDGSGGVLPQQLMGFDDSGPFAIDNVNETAGLNPHFTIFGGNLYFAGSVDDPSSPGSDVDGQLIELQADGTVNPITLTAGHVAFSFGDYGGFTQLGDSLYFAAFMDGSGNTSANPDLIKLDLDGTLTDISTRTDVASGSSAGEDGGVFAFGNSIYFNATSDTPAGDTLFRLDAGSTTPVAVDPSGTTFTHETGVSSAFTIFDGNLYFNEFQTGGNDTLFKMDGDGNVTALSYHGEALVNAGTNGYGELGDSLYFTAQTADTGTDLFKLDSSGTLTAIDIAPGGGAGGDSNAGEFGGFVQFAGALYFFADDPNNFGAETLFRMDSSGTATPVDAGSDGAAGTSLLSTGEDAHFFVFGDTLLLRAQTAEGDELVEVAPDGSTFVDDINDDLSGNSFPGQNGGFATQGLTTLNGTNGNDILVGCDELDSLNGGPGNDLLWGREESDILTGGDGADIFKFSEASALDFDLVTDYTFAAGDKIDLTDLLSAYGPGDHLSDFVHVSTFLTGLLITVDDTGSGSGFEPVAFLEGVTGDITVTTPLGDQIVHADIAPTLTLSGGTPTALKQVPLVLDAGVRVNDDSGMLNGAEVFITNPTYAGPQDTLDIGSLAGTNITLSVNTAGEITLTGLDTVAHYQQVLRTVTYTNTSATPDTSDRDIEFSVDDDDGGTSHVVTETIHVKATNVAPAMGGAGTSAAYTEQAAPVTLDGAITASDADDDSLKGATVTISNAVAGDRLTINGTASGAVLGADGIILYSFTGSTLTLSGTDSPADYQAALQLVQFDSTSDDPDSHGSNLLRTIDWQVTDPVNATSTLVHTTVNITAVDDPAVAHNDAVTTASGTVLSGGSVFANNGSGADSDPDGGAAFGVVSVNGVTAAVGHAITLSSGALLTLNADGTFTYDPNHAFDTLAGSLSGASDIQATDGFAYAITGGSTATVTVTVTGVDDAATIYQGSGGDDHITGGPGGHLFDLTGGGNDTVTGGTGNDGFKFGGTLQATDHIDGGAGGNDQIQVDGDYSGGVTIGASITGVEVLAMVAGHNYKFTTTDGLVASGQTFTFWSVTMAASNFVNIDGSAELDGKFQFFLGQGNDIAKGGLGDDLFYGEGGKDTLTGGGGADTFAYLGASDSSGTSFDVITDFNVAQNDKFKLGVTPTSVTTLSGGHSLADATFQTDVDAAVNGSLSATNAVLFTAGGGDHDGHVFLVVEANGTAGYQNGGDYIFDLTGGSLAGLGGGNFI